MRDLVILQLGKGLRNIDPTRKIFKSFKGLPSVGTPFVVIESAILLPTDDTFGEKVYGNGDLPLTFTKEVVKGYEWQLDITAASDDTEGYLSDLFEYHRDDEWLYEYFSNHNISLVGISPIREASVATVNADWELRSTCRMTLRFMAKKSTTLNTIDLIEGGFTVSGGSAAPDITDTLTTNT